MLFKFQMSSNFCLLKKVKNIRVLNANKLKGELSGLKQLLATKNPLEIMKNSFYFTLKPPFGLEIFLLEIIFKKPTI